LNERLLDDVYYAAATWEVPRRLVMKAEWLEKGGSPRVIKVLSMIGIRYFFAGLAVVLLGTPSAAWGQLSEIDSWTATLHVEYRVIPNITYHVASSHEGKLDLYVPLDMEKRHPTAIYIHGGGWSRGAKEDNALLILPYIARGWAVVNVGYRLADVSLAPAAVEDCRCALWWVLRNASKYNFDTDRIVITGLSAGGHLALTTGMLPRSTELDLRCPPITESQIVPLDPKEFKVAAIINWFGITDVVDLLDGPNQKAYAVNWFGNQLDREAIAQRVSPLTYVRSDLPPILTIHGDADRVVPYSHAVQLHDALTRAGVPNQLFTIPKGDHGIFTRDQMRQVYETIWSFLDRHGVQSKVKEDPDR